MIGSALVRHLAASALVLSLSLVAAGSASAQSLDFLSGGAHPLGAELVEREDVERTLGTSYASALLQRIRAVVADAATGEGAFDASAHARRSRAAFLDEVRTTLLELEGDGALTLAEVGEAIPPIRERHLERFGEVIEARSRGHVPPPASEAGGPGWQRALEMTRYVVSTRNPASAWVRVVLASLGGVAIAAGLAFLLRVATGQLDHREHTLLAASIASVHTPLMLSAGTWGLLVGLDHLWLPSDAESTLRAVLTGTIVACVFRASWNLCAELAAPLGQAASRLLGHDLGAQGRLVILRALRVLVFAAALSLLVRTVLDANLAGLVASLGAAGVGIWFLARGFVENVAASFTLFGDGVFGVGDTVVHDGQWGVIEDIGFRSTRCRTFDGHLLHIPNRILVEETVRNVSARPFIRSRFRLSLELDTPPAGIEEAMRIVRAVIEAQGERIARSEGVHVVLDGFGAHDLQLLVQFCTASDDYWSGKAVIGDVNLGIRRRFEEAGLRLAIPVSRTRLESDASHPPSLRLAGGGEGAGVRDGTGSPPVPNEPPRPYGGGSVPDGGFDEAA